MNARRGTNAASRQPVRRGLQGASLPLALMLFLICALLASVVLAASTTAVGRNAKLAEMDQRYYSAVSAAGVVQQAFQGKQVQVQCVQEKDVTTIVTYSADGSVVRGTPSENVKSYKLTVDGTTVLSGAPDAPAALTTTGLSLPQLAALHVLLGSNATGAVAVESAWTAAGLSTDPAAGTVQLGTYDLTANVTTVPRGADTAAVQNALKATAYEFLVDGSSVEFQIDSAASASSDIFSVTFACDADLDASEWSEEEKTTTQAGSGTVTRTETRAVTTTREVNVSWVPSELQKTGAGAAGVQP